MVKVVQVDQVTVKYGDTLALDRISMSVEAGEVVALIGPNGAGKTTLFEAIQGYQSPQSGSVTVFGHNPTSDRAEINARWGVMPQTNGLPMGLTVAEAISLFSELGGQGHDPVDLMKQTGLTKLAKRRWRKLSGGEQQRLSLAIALAGGNDLLLLDEPTAAVDQEGRDRILALISDRSAAGASIVMSTHRLDDAEACADRVYVLDRGRLAGSGSIDELTTVTDSVRVRSSTGLDVAQLSALAGAPVSETTTGVYQVDTDPTPDNVARIVQCFGALGVPVEGVDASRTSLDEVLRKLVQNGNES